MPQQTWCALFKSDGKIQSYFYPVRYPRTYAEIVSISKEHLDLIISIIIDTLGIVGFKLLRMFRMSSLGICVTFFVWRVGNN